MYSIHEISSMFGFDRKENNNRRKQKIVPHKTKKVPNDDDERWSLYTKKAATLRQSSFG